MKTNGLKTLIILFAILLNDLTIETYVLSQQVDHYQKGKNKNGNSQKDNQNKNKLKPDFKIDINKMIGNIVIGCPTDNSICINIIAAKDIEVYAEYGTESSHLKSKTEVSVSKSDGAFEMKISNLKKNTKYFYQLYYRFKNEKEYISSTINSFYTQRETGSSFSFGVQGDSHPERPGKMFSPELYNITMKNVAVNQPDFYFLMGDDFSIDKLIEKNEANQKNINDVYLNQREYLGAISQNSPIFLVNGNHEQAAKYLLDGKADNPAVLAANARINNYPLPIPADFYSGDTEKIEHIGYLRDYYAWEWGDALFIVIDPYWHSDSVVDNVAGKKEKTKRNPWNITLGETQYKWFKQTLENSKAKYKFVFSHHVLGTGRGGVERAGLFEWGGLNQKGEWEFDKKRPGWEMPIHQLMVKNKVSIFFQGHDHLFCKQELDGVVYQSVPNPADNTYTAFNANAYKSGDILPNSGFIKVKVSPENVQVEYIRSFLSADETEQNKNGGIACKYSVKGK